MCSERKTGSDTVTIRRGTLRKCSQCFRRWLALPRLKAVTPAGLDGAKGICNEVMPYLDGVELLLELQVKIDEARNQALEEVEKARISGVYIGDGGRTRAISSRFSDLSIGIDNELRQRIDHLLQAVRECLADDNKAELSQEYLREFVYNFKDSVEGVLRERYRRQIDSIDAEQRILAGERGQQESVPPEERGQQLINAIKENNERQQQLVEARQKLLDLEQELLREINALFAGKGRE